MKKKLNKLTLSKETLRVLSARDLRTPVGGDNRTVWYECWGTLGCPEPFTTLKDETQPQSQNCG